MTFTNSNDPKQQQRAMIRDYIQEQNDSHQVVVWSKTYCPYCAASKRLLMRLQQSWPNLDVVVHELDTDSTGDVIQQELFHLTQQATVPSIWVNGQHIGGNDDLQATARNGKLRELLNTTTATITTANSTGSRN